MKLGIMQPYFMPYIGYWQRINAVDRHIIYDDVNYIKNGWMNRNRILLNGKEHLFSMNLIGASPNKLINEVCVNNNEILQNKMIKTLEQAYKKSPYFYDIMDECLEPIIKNKEENLAKYLEYQIRKICNYMDIDTELVMSSSIEKDNSLKGRDKVVEICKLQGAGEYYNALSGDHLYNKQDFANEGIKLVFMRDKSSVSYKQQSDKFIPSLSIIDVLMNCSKDEIKILLNDYELL